MKDQSLPPVLNGTSMESKRLFTSTARAIRPDNCGESIRDWVFESNSDSHKPKTIRRLVGTSPAMAELRSRIARYAKTEAPVLVCGESGTGKELIAKILHDMSPRNNCPFVAINCAAIPSPLAESELFGSAKGAFTGAIHGRGGLLARANRGTLFLDEFGELVPAVQSKLLRALDNGSYFPVGANKEERADFRIVAATNRDLERSMLKGEFRADLYYRINVLQLNAPPLREHRDDIPEIIREILGELLPAGSKIQITKQVMSELLQAPWPGNIRELRNVLRRSLVMSSGNIIDRLECDRHSPTLNLSAAHGERKNAERLTDALLRNRGRLAAVAQELDVSVRTVQRRMKDRGLRLRDFRDY